MTTNAVNHEDHHHHEEENSKVIFGFWIFILTNFIMFAVLLVTYVVLRNNTYGGITIKDIVNLPHTLLQSLVFLTSSFTYGLTIISAKQNSKPWVMFWLVVTFIIGLVFLGLEHREFSNILATGHSWQSSAFLSSFFTLLGFHALNVIVGLLWIIILMVQLSLQNFTPTMRTRFACLGLYWDYLNVVWIFIYTVVYLMGAI